MDKKRQLEDLRRTFDIYFCNLSVLGISQKYMNGDSPYKDLAIIIANEKNGYGSSLIELISSVSISDEIFCESQDFIVFGPSSRREVQTLLGSLDKTAANKLKRFKGIPVVVADCDVINIFSYQRNKFLIKPKQIK